MNADNTTGLKELHDRLKLALSGTADELFQVMQDTAPEPLFASLRNPNLAEDHLLVLLKRSDLPEKLVETIARMPQGRESHRLRLALARNPKISAALLMELLPHIHLFELVDLCTLPGANADLKVATEREITRRLPTTPLGNKITLARRGTPGLLKALMMDGAPQVVEATLDNPRLAEGVLHQFLRSAKATEESISLIGRHPRWSQRPLLRQSILKAPRTPDVWYTLWLPKLNIAAVRELASSTRIPMQRRQLVKQELKRRGL